MTQTLVYELVAAAFLTPMLVTAAFILWPRISRRGRWSDTGERWAEGGPPSD